MKVSDYNFIIVGAGFFGATVAERLAARGEKVLVIDRREHVAGNAYSYRDKKTGIEIHQYGSHIFHTDNEEVWNYITRFTDFNDYTHTVPTRHNGELYPMPINLDTINKLYSTDMNAEEAEKFVAEEARRDCERLGIVEPKNFEEKGISLVGEKLYSTFIKHYSEKQWSTAAENLSAEILKRIPVRYSHDDRYFMDAKHQGIPVNGYGKIVENMLDSENIEVRLGTTFDDIRDDISDKAKIVYCGQVDELLDYKFGVLPYRSLRFEDEWTEDSQNVIDGVGHAVINEADSDVAYTRAHDYKFYQTHEPEVINQKMSYVCREYPANFEKGGEAYYPVNNPESAALYEKYVKELHDTYPNIILGGRLGAYQYWDMDKAIANALELAKSLKVKPKVKPKKDDKISIIIPVYNLENHIVECLKSAIHQTYKNYEIVVVDDGSTDNSLKVCRDFRDKHPSKNIRVIHTRNYGLSHARNRGISGARGKYICFVDGDDTIEPGYIDSLHRAIVSEKAEIAVCGYRPIRDLFMKEKFIRGSQLPIRETTDGETATIRFLIGQRNLDVVTWNKMYLKSLFKKNKIKFPDGEIFEDKLTTYKLYYAAKRVTLVDEVLYNYRQREGSIMNTADMKRRINGRLKAAREAEKYLKKAAGRKSEVAKAAAISVALAHFAFLDNAVTKRIAPSNFKRHRAWVLKNAKKLQDNAYITKKMRLYIMMLRPFDGAIYRTFRKVRHESLYVF